MNKVLQILLLSALFASTARAGEKSREESLEERKRRIMREYQRERGKIAESDLLVPSDMPEEDERLVESERFGEVGSSLQAEDRAAMPLPPPPSRPMSAQRARENWLLADPEIEEGTEEFEKGTSDYWAMFGEDRERRSTAAETRASRRYDPYGASTDRAEYFDPRGANPNARSEGFGRPRSSPYASGLGAGASSVYGSGMENEPTAPSFGRYGARGEAEEESVSRGFGTTRRESAPSWSYKSPYDLQYEQRQRNASGIYKDREERSPYQKPNNYEAWKQNNPSWDPTKDDAYVDELMRGER